MRAHPLMIAAVAGVVVVIASALATADAPSSDPATAGKRAFVEIARVLQSPRCRNCHPSGNAPLQTDAGIPHAMNISRATAASRSPRPWCNAASVAARRGPLS